MVWSLILLVPYDDVLLTSNVPVEELYVPSFKNYDFYMNASSLRGVYPGVSVDFNGVPGPARTTMFLGLRSFPDSLRTTFLTNYSRYMGIIDLGFNVFLSHTDVGEALPRIASGVSFNLSSYSKAIGLGLGVSYAAPALVSGVGDGQREFGVFLFHRRGSFHRGGKGYRLLLGYSSADGGTLKTYGYLKLAGINPFVALHYRIRKGDHTLKLGSRLTSDRLNFHFGIVLKGGRVGYVLSIGAVLPR